MEPSGDAENKSQKPEWIRVKDAVRAFGFSQSYLYELMKSKKVDTRRMGQSTQKPVLLIRYQSIVDLVENSPK